MTSGLAGSKMGAVTTAPARIPSLGWTLPILAGCASVASCAPVAGCGSNKLGTGSRSQEYSFGVCQPEPQSPSRGGGRTTPDSLRLLLPQNHVFAAALQRVPLMFVSYRLAVPPCAGYPVGVWMMKRLDCARRDGPVSIPPFLWRAVAHALQGCAYASQAICVGEPQRNPRIACGKHDLLPSPKQRKPRVDASST